MSVGLLGLDIPDICRHRNVDSASSDGKHWNSETMEPHVMDAFGFLLILCSSSLYGYVKTFVIQDSVHAEIGVTPNFF